jgi:putative transposase
VQQLREAFAFGTAPRYVILDRDRKYGSVVPEKLRSWGVKLVHIAWRSPWQNGLAERWVSSVRRELLAHVVVLNEAHLRQLVADYVAYYNIDRCHLALDKDASDRRQRQGRPGPAAQVGALPRAGGIHHRYEWSDSPRIAA